MMFDSEPTDKSQSFLAADIADNVTTVSLFDKSEAGYRLVGRAAAPTTLRAPWLDLSHGVHQAVSRLANITNRSLLDRAGSLILPDNGEGAGVDSFAATFNAAPPLKVLLAGLTKDFSLESARNSLTRAYAQEIANINLEDGEEEGAQINLILDLKPDVILLVGGKDGADSPELSALIDRIALGVELLASQEFQRPQLLYAGNSAMRERVANKFSQFTTVHVADNIRPNGKSENLAPTIDLLNQLYEDIQIAKAPGIEILNNWTERPTQPTAQAVSTICQFFAKVNKGLTTCIDINGDNMTVCVADNEQTWLSIHPQLGIGKSINGLLKLIPPEQIVHWLDDGALGIEEVKNYVHAKALYPQTTPVKAQEIQLEQTIAQEAIRHGFNSSLGSWGWDLEKPPHTNLVLLRGEIFSRMSRAGQTMLMALNALQPTGVFPVSIDRYGVMPALGSLALTQPLTAIQSMEAGLLYDLGWVIAPAIREKAEKPILRLHLKHEDGRALEMEITNGSLELLPLAVGDEAELTIKPLSRKIDVGFGGGKSKKIKIIGGALGLVIDARGRPLKLSDDEEGRRQMLQKWRWDLGS